LRVGRSISLHLTKEEYSFILNMARQCASSSGTGISERTILQTLIRLLQLLKVDASGIKTEDQLLQRLHKAIQGNQTYSC
jgi:hypothetical protein